jgi:hypothetical protein
MSASFICRSPAKAGVQSGRFQRMSAVANQLVTPNWAPAFAGEREVSA